MIERKIDFVKGDIPLRRIREELGLTQEQFAVAIRASTYSVSRWERGRTVNLTVAQVKAFQTLLKQIGLDFQDLPDDLSLPLE
jgi:transcriptional regulator with XRE-family HTH domain